MIVEIDGKHYKLTIAKLKEILTLNRKEITLQYDFGSFVLKGLNKKYVKELDRIL